MQRQAHRTAAAAGRPADIWLLAAGLVVAGAYLWLALIRPGGEGWGRGWNLIAFLIYASPATLLAGALAVWRAIKTSGRTRWIASVVAAAGLVFPLIAAIAIIAKG